MIQRIQSIYLFVASALLVTSGFVGNIYNIITRSSNTTYGYNAITKYTLDSKEVIETTPQYLWVYPIVLAVFGLYTMISFKDLKKQVKLARMFWGFIILTLLVQIGIKYYMQMNVEKGDFIQAAMGAQFFLTVIAMPFSHLAFMSILKDKRTIESIDRIR